jgi:hypothetical protein
MSGSLEPRDFIFIDCLPVLSDEAVHLNCRIIPSS